ARDPALDLRQEAFRHADFRSDRLERAARLLAARADPAAELAVFARRILAYRRRNPGQAAFLSLKRCFSYRDSASVGGRLQGCRSGGLAQAKRMTIAVPKTAQ